jgi:FkbM family methyltransferase
MDKKLILKKYNLDALYKNDIYIFGARLMGKKIFHELKNENINVRGFIDNNNSLIGTFINEPDGKVYNLKNIEKDSLIIVATMNYMQEILLQLKNENYKNIIPCYILSLWKPHIFKPEIYYDGLYEEYQDNKEKYFKTRSLFNDEKSLEVFDVLVNFRENFEINIFNKIIEDSKNQYFEDFVPKESVFVDCGAFDGDSTLSYINFVQNNYEKIYCFEPDELSYNKCVSNLLKYDNIQNFKKGVFKSEEILKFSSQMELGSKISNEGDCTIETVKLDNIVKETRAFIKMDIEGVEIDALKGASDLIKNNSTLAICVYHKPSDLWKIPEIILAINPNYQLYLRHYTSSLFDTVLYAIPNKFNK